MDSRRAAKPLWVPLSVHPVDESVLDACMYGQLDVLQLLCQQSGGIIHDLDLCVTISVLGGHRHVTDFLLTQSAKGPPSKPASRRLAIGHPALPRNAVSVPASRRAAKPLWVPLHCVRPEG